MMMATDQPVESISSLSKRKKKPLSLFVGRTAPSPTNMTDPTINEAHDGLGASALGCTWAQYNVSMCTAGRSTILTFLPGRGQLIATVDEPINYACVL